MYGFISSFDGTLEQPAILIHGIGVRCAVFSKP
jgi:hypothetical protein